jgi:hypothetical protein
MEQKNFTLEDELFWLEEHLGEVETQYRSECALYGDAGPGQAYNIARLKNIRASLIRRIELRDKANR